MNKKKYLTELDEKIKQLEKDIEWFDFKLKHGDEMASSHKLEAMKMRYLLIKGKSIYNCMENM